MSITGRLIPVGGWLALTGVLALAGPAAAADDALVEKGRYLSIAAGCSSCHTAKDGAAYAGGHVLRTPFGPLATANITQDEETGIGNWTRDEFEGALRRGVNDDGMPLYPAMPYLHYTKITDDDIDALWAYIQTIPPVRHEVEVNRLPFPFNVRASVFGWQAIYFDEGRFAADQTRDDVWNRGAYLVQALGHCGACHTPRDPLGGPKTAHALEGGPIEEWYAPDISGGPGSILADWDVKRLESFLSDQSTMNHVAVGSMSQVVEELSQMNADDVHAIAIYLKNQPANSDTDETDAEERSVTPEMRAAWGTLFKDRCSSCHGENGQGAPGLAASLVDAGGVVAARPDNVISVLLEGIGPSDQYGAMPSFADSLTDSQIADLANYVRTAWGNDAPPNAHRTHVAGLRSVTTVNAEAVAGASCPNVPSDRIDEPTRKVLADLASSRSVSADGVSQAVSLYNAHNPDATATQRMVDLSGVYCQDIVKSGARQSVVTMRQLDFIDALSAL